MLRIVSFIRFLGESRKQFAFEIYWPLTSEFPFNFKNTWAQNFAVAYLSEARVLAVLSRSSFLGVLLRGLPILSSSASSRPPSRELWRPRGESAKDFFGELFEFVELFPWSKSLSRFRLGVTSSSIANGDGPGKKIRQKVKKNPKNKFVKKSILPDIFFWSFFRNGILFPKLIWPTVRKKCSSDREKHLKFKTEGQEFAKFFRSLEQFIQTVKGQNNFW